MTTIIETERPWVDAGQVTICPKGRPKFPAVPEEPGLYRLEIGDVIYIGHGENLKRRLSEYRNSTDSVDEHFRRDLIVKAGGARLFYMTGSEFRDKKARQRLEQVAIQQLRVGNANLINKGDVNRRDYYQFKIAFLEGELEKAKKILQKMH